LSEFKEYTPKTKYIEMCENIQQAENDVFLGSRFLINRKTKQALAYFEKAAIKQHPEAMSSLGKILFFGDEYGAGKIMDKPRGAKILQESSDLGNIQAMLLIGISYENKGQE